MTEIKTTKGTFGKFKDLYLYMCEEDIEQIKVSLYYNFSLVSQCNIGRAELQIKLEQGQLV